ncbi:MAG: PHP domain-containing protein [Dehalococcoidia bacterium]|nr:PHP domain-containing protein [Dehalococcoidia bacterium]
MPIADLHLHTTASDGRLTPTQLIELVAGRGLKGVAVTDHDSTEGLAEAFAAAAAYPDLRVVPGIELSTDVPGNEIHVLAYYIQYTDPGVQERLARFREGRVDRARKMVEKLRELGVEIEWDRVQAIAGEGAVGRPHLALAMVEKGYIKEPREAFDAYIGRNGPAYVEREKLTPVQAVELIRDWGGAAVVAHPGWMPDLDPTLEELKRAGLVGMEVYYAQYSPERIRELAAVAANHGLLACGGSDYHGLGNTGEPLPGNMGPPLDMVDRLRELATRPASIPA